jgi:hypothetical protein
MIQTTARMFFRAITISMLILNYDPKAIWALPLSVLIGICSESEQFKK